VGAGILFPYDHLDLGFFDFRHQLLRDALYRSAPAAERRRLHARAAEFGKGLVGASEVHASVHYERAGLRADAFRAAMAGAKAAGAMVSRFEEFELYRRAIANIPDGLTASELGDLYVAYGASAFSVDDVPAIEDAMTRARRYFIDAGRPIDAAATLISLSGHARRDVRPRSERIALLEQAEAELSAQPASPERAGALADVRFMQAILEIDGVRLPETRALLAEHLAFAAEAGLDQTLMEITRLDVDHMLGMADALGGDVIAGLARMIGASREARDKHFESTGVTGYRVAADMAIRFMEYSTSTVGLSEGLRYADEIEQSYCRHVLSATASHLAWVEGRWDEATPIAEIELVEPGSRRGTLGSRSVLGFVALGRGDVARARQLLEEALAIARPSGEIDLVLPALWGMAETALVAGDPARAFDHCQEAVELAAPTGERALLVPFIVTGTRAAIAARRPEAAERWFERVKGLLVSWQELARPAMEHANGLIRLSAGASASARTSLEAAVAGWDARGRIWESTWARLDLAQCLVRSNRYGEALRILEQVVEIATRLGSTPILERAEELGRLARARGGELEAWHPLTAREFEVAKLIAQGLTNAEIGEAIFVSPKTVSAHVEHMLAKLGVARRTEIAAWIATVLGPVAPESEAATPMGAGAAN
jgi:DNA-binding CsgD family transcriptional regulator